MLRKAENPTLVL